MCLFAKGLHGSHDSDVEKLKDVFPEISSAKIGDLLKHHDVCTAAEILMKPLLDEDDPPVVDLTVSLVNVLEHCM